MKGFALWLASAVLLCFEAAALAQGPVSCHLSFENLDFAKHDWVEQTGLKRIAERKWELVDGRFGKAIFLGAVPRKYDSDNMSGLDLDLVSAVTFNIGGAQ